MRSSVPEKEEKKTMMGSEGGVNRGSSKNTNISGGVLYDDSLSPCSHYLCLHDCTAAL